MISDVAWKAISVLRGLEYVEDEELAADLRVAGYPALSVLAEWLDAGVLVNARNNVALSSWGRGREGPSYYRVDTARIEELLADPEGENGSEEYPWPDDLGVDRDIYRWKHEDYPHSRIKRLLLEYHEEIISADSTIDRRLHRYCQHFGLDLPRSPTNAHSREE